MNKVFLAGSMILLLILLPGIGYSQTTTRGENVKPFSTMVSADSDNYYFSVDLTRFPGFFERAFLLDLIFKDSQLVVNNSSLSGPTLALLSSKLHDQAELTGSIEGYCLKALSAGKTIPADQKELLLKKYSKYR